jgi:hypothetical protein
MKSRESLGNILKKYIQILDANLNRFKFLDAYNQPKLNQEDIKHLNMSITNNEVEAAIKALPIKKNSRLDRFTAEFY